MLQTQSVGPVGTVRIGVLLTVNIVSHNPEQSSSDKPSEHNEEYSDNKH